LRFVYQGNVAGSGGEDTLCPGCGSTLIRRQGFRSEVKAMRGGRCLGCGSLIHGVWAEEAGDMSDLRFTGS